MIYGFGEQEMTAIPKKRTKGTHFVKQFVDLMDNSSGRLKKNMDMGISIRYFPIMSRERTLDNETSDQSPTVDNRYIGSPRNDGIHHLSAFMVCSGTACFILEKTESLV